MQLLAERIGRKCQLPGLRFHHVAAAAVVLAENFLAFDQCPGPLVRSYKRTSPWGIGYQPQHERDDGFSLDRVNENWGICSRAVYFLFCVSRKS